MSALRTPWWRRLAAEPLLHFLVLALLIFALDASLREPDAERATLVVPLQVQDEARQLFEAGTGRVPEPAELQPLLDRWVQHEALYREGLAQGLDRGDRVIRDRIAEKTLRLTEAGLGLPADAEAAVRSRQLEAAVERLVGRYRVEIEPRTR
jgi:hypothetical protein